MGTATSRANLGLVALATATLLAGCGTSGGSSGAVATHTALSDSAQQAAGGPFAWLQPRPAPANWTAARIPTGAVLSYPPGWTRERSDTGAATAVVRGSDGQIRGYLNVTPRQGEETLADWASFRAHHNAREGDRDVREEAAAQGLRFRNGQGSCVRDRYTTVTGAHYVELACLVAAPNRSTVIVAAAPPQAWAELGPALEQAISSFTA